MIMFAEPVFNLKNKQIFKTNFSSQTIKKAKKVRAST